MKRFILSALFILLSGMANAQTEELNINYEEIKSKIEDSNSATYYPLLLERYRNFDPSLTLDEYALLYYGFSFQEEYLKNQVAEMYLDQLIRAERYEEALSEGLQLLDKDPVSLKINFNTIYAMDQAGYPEEEYLPYLKRYWMIQKVIAYSGNGLSAETPFKTIYISDEYNMMYQYFDIETIHSQSLVGLCDYFRIAPSRQYRSKHIYFDISRKLIRQDQLLQRE